MPVYRQRDRLADLRDRNDIIFDVCVDRMEAGAAMAFFEATTTPSLPFVP